MDKLLEQQHQQDGTDNLSLDELKKAFGGILSFIKSKMEGFDFSKITDAVPEAKDLVTEAETENSRAAPTGSAADLMSSAMSMFGGGGASAPAAAPTTGDGAAATNTPAPIDSMPQLLGYLTKAGINPSQIMSLLPVVAGFLKEHAGIDVSSALGTPPAAPAAAAATTTTTPAVEGEAAAAPASSKDAMGNLMDQASGFMSSFSKK